MRDRRKNGKARQSSGYDAWSSMIQRCLNSKNKDYRWYGARGITVCSRWLDFENFYQDMGPRPSNKHSLDRIDNSRGYLPQNCRWALQLQQVRNSRHCTYLIFQGQRKCISEWAEIFGINRLTIHSRLRKGWPTAKVLLQPVRTMKKWR